ncbi:serine hydrolase domain-containing protein [Flavitalea sp.]|nr:serine hydrolase domain-containing protein [Flavitalea sp.]
MQSVHNAGRFNGNALVVYRGNIVLHRSYGVKDTAAKVPLDTNSIFLIASVTKTFTSAVVFKLIEEGKLDLRDKVSKYLPAFPNGDRISIRNLLTHSSGIGNIDIEETDTIAWKPLNKEQVLAAFQNEPLKFSPGSSFSYTNSNYFLLGLIVEKASSKSYYDLVRQYILRPMDMFHTGFDFINLTNPDKASGFTMLSTEKRVLAHNLDSTITLASGDMYSTTGDLLKWARAVNDTQFLKRRSWDSVFSVFKENYAHGWLVRKFAGKKCYWHSGGTFGFASVLARFPDDDLTIILLSNVQNSSNQTLLPFSELASITFGNEVADYSEEVIKDINPRDYSVYIGTYSMKSDRNRKMVIAIKNGYLTATLPGTALQLEFSSKTKFFFKNLPRDIFGEFIVDGGKVIKLIMNQGGQFEWDKIE